MKRSFWSLVAVQIQVLLNDNAAKLMLITLGAAVAPELLPQNYSLHHQEYADMVAKQIKTILAAIIILPFILFAPTAGWVSTRFSKRNVIVMSLWANRDHGMIGTALWFPLICGLCHLSASSCSAFSAPFFSPAKQGIIKEIVTATKNQLGGRRR